MNIALIFPCKKTYAQMVFISSLLGLFLSINLFSLTAVASSSYQKDRGSILLQNEGLGEGEALVSPGGDFVLMTQSDGNLCVSHQLNGAGIWCSRDTVASGRNFVTYMQTDGNLCTVGSEGISWCLKREPQYGGPFFLALQDDANLCVYKGTPSNITGNVWCSMHLASPLPHGAQLTYGSTYYIKNNYAGRAATYLDVRGSGCQGNLLCVSTASSNERDKKGSGSWILMSAQGKPDRSTVKEGDLVYLANKYPYGFWGSLVNDAFGGFLDVRGPNCEGNKLCVSTSISQNRDGMSGTWKVEGRGEKIYLGQGVQLRNQYDQSYLDTKKSGCYDNILCVSTSISSNRDNGSGTWSFELAKDVSESAALARIKYYVETYSPRVRLHPDDPYLPESADFYASKSGMYVANISDEGSVSDAVKPAVFFYTSDAVAGMGISAAERNLRQALAPSSSIRVWMSPDKDKDLVKLGNLDRAKTYVTVNKHDNILTIKYWYFFGYNGAGRIEGCSSSSVCVTKQASSYGRHDGDWEHAEVDVTESGIVQAVRLSRHGDNVGVAIEEWDLFHPIIYSAFYSHALYPNSGQQNYQRIASKDWWLGTASIDLFDRTSGGGQTFRISGDASYELVALSGVVNAIGGELSVVKRDIFKFGGRWGRYEDVQESFDLPFFSVTLLKEVGAGPNTPDFK